MRIRVLCLLAVASFLLLSVAGVTQASVNQPPVADAGPDLTGTTSVAMTLDGSSSYDIDGTIVLYEWDFESDGVYDFSSATSAVTSYAYTVLGVYTATLRVTDDGGLTDTDTTIVAIFNQPPVADADGPYTGTVGIPVTLDASGSWDPDDNIILYEWDLDNDGEFDDATGVTATVAFWSTGTYVVGLRVTDEYGDADMDVAIVTITEANGVPEFPLTLPVLTSLAAALYLALKKRIGKKLE